MHYEHECFPNLKMCLLNFLCEQFTIDMETNYESPLKDETPFERKDFVKMKQRFRANL